MSRSIDRDPLYQNLLFYLPMREGVGTAVQDVARPRHPVTMNHDPAWTQITSGLRVLDFTKSHPDYLSVAAASAIDLAFTSENFSACAWVMFDTLAAQPNESIFMCHGASSVAGWWFQADAVGAVHVFTNLAGHRDWSSLNNGAVTTSTWYLLGFSRSGASVRIHKNGIDGPLQTTGAHDAFVASTGYNFYVGAYNDLSKTYAHDGKVGGPRIWGRALSSREHMEIFLRERKFFGV